MRAALRRTGTRGRAMKETMSIVASAFCGDPDFALIVSKGGPVLITDDDGTPLAYLIAADELKKMEEQIKPPPRDGITSK